MTIEAKESDTEAQSESGHTSFIHESDLDFENSDATIQKILLEALTAVRKHFAMDYAFLSEFTDTERVFKGVSARSNEPKICAGDSGSLEDSYCQRVVDGRLPELITNAANVPEASMLEVTKSFPVGAHMSTPIRFQDGTVYGTLCCFSHEANDELDERDLGVLRLFSEFVSAQLERFVKRQRRTGRLVSQIRSIIDGCKYETFVQPIVNLEDEEVAGYEALTRFSEEPYRPPNVWFDEAGSVNLGVELELATLCKAIRYISEFPGRTYVSLNVSPETVLHQDFDACFADAPLDRIALEVTEHLAISDYGEIVMKFERLREQGIKIVIDDAGAGYASFRHILQINPDIIKLDRSIISGIDQSPGNRALAAALVKYAAETDTKTVAEGVETQSELDVLKTLGINKVQGYLLGKPVPVEQVVQCL